MKQGNLPKQEYKLISMCMQGVENGIAYSCSDCGRTIFNFAIIKGEMDNKEYIVGLTCVNKLLNKTIYFSNENYWEYGRQLACWQSAMNARKWLTNVLKKVCRLMNWNIRNSQICSIVISR